MAISTNIINYLLAGLLPTLLVVYYFAKRIRQMKLDIEWNAKKRTKDLEKHSKQLELQKHEIRLQTEELKTVTERLQESHDILLEQKSQLQSAYQNAKLLSEFGQKITSTLSRTEISAMVYRHVRAFIHDISGFGLGIYNPKNTCVEFHHFVEKGELQPIVSYPLSSKESLTVACFKYKKEISIANFEAEWSQHIRRPQMLNSKDAPKSFIYLPLTFEGRPIGVIRAQSLKEKAFSRNHITHLRSLASYIAIALENARGYRIIHEQNKHIKSSIEAAETIQKASLPMLDKLASRFDIFVLYRPKDIVSGDFYWCATTDDPNVHFVAVVDCTGHGIPGAFVSMIGSSLLNEIIKEKKVSDTAKILEELDNKIKISLQQQETGNSDGMDVCLCRIQQLDADNFRVSFTGAKRPLLYTDFSYSLQLAKGDKKMIGKFNSRVKRAFTTQHFNLNKGATLFLTTDGFVDQHNAQRKKFGTPRLLGFLHAHIHQPMHTIHKLLNNKLDEHMGQEAQRDDITVVGIRL